MPTTEHAYLFKNAVVEGLSLSPYPRNAHKLHILNLAEILLNEREVAREVERDAEGDEAGGEAVAGAIALSRG